MRLLKFNEPEGTFLQTGPWRTQRNTVESAAVAGILALN